MPPRKQISVRRPAAHEVFTDRDGERERLNSFFDGLCSVPMKRDKPLLAFYGVGGVGKTSVKNESIRAWREASHPGSIKLTFADCGIDSEEFTPEHSVMAFFGNVLRPALRKAGFAIPLFETFFCTWFGRTNPDTEMSRSSLLSSALGIGEQSTDLGARVIEGLDSLGSAFKGATLAIKAATAFRDLRRRRKLAETLPELELNSLTLKQFHDYAGQILAVDLLTALGDDPNKALCIVIDGFERIQSREMRADLQHEFQSFALRLLLAEPPVRCGVVILGREQLRWRALYDEPDNEDNHWDLYIEHALLGGLAEQDARLFLRRVANWYQGTERTANERRVGEIIAAHLEAILRQAEEEPGADRNYYPYSLDLAIEQAIQHSENFEPGALGRGAKDLQARFLRDLDRRERAALHVLAVALEFDLGLFKHLVQESVIVDYPVQGLYELVAPAFVIEDTQQSGLFRFHRKMSEALLADLLQQPGGQEQVAQIVGVVQRYYRTRIEGQFTADPAEAARAYNRVAKVLTEHGISGRLAFEQFADFFTDLESGLSAERFDYFNLDGRIVAAQDRLRLTERNRGPEDSETATVLDDLAVLLLHLGDYSVARPQFERALTIRETVLGPEHLDTASSLSNLASCFLQMHDFESARPLLDRALNIRERALGFDRSETAIVLSNLASCLQRMDDHGAARPLFERALSILEKELGPEHPRTALTLNNLACALSRQGDYAAARPLFERALTISEDVLGPHHPYAATITNNFADALLEQGDHAAARPLFERALASLESGLGPEHPNTASGLNNLVRCLQGQGDYAAVGPLFERALAILERELGPEHPKTALTLSDMASALSNQGEYAAARPLFERALAILEREFGPEHRNTALTLNNLATALFNQQDYAAAQLLFERVLGIREKALGTDHLDTTISLNNVASCLYRQGDYAAARPLFERVLAIREEALGPEHLGTATSLNNLASCVQRLGDPAAAKALRDRALAIREKGSRSR